MVNPLFALIPMLLFAPADAPKGAEGMRVTQLRIQRQVVIPVPRMVPRTAAMSSYTALPPIGWAERRADRCVAVGQLAAAAVTRPDSVDLVLSGGKRVRAKLGNECPALDFYSGFYLKPNKDGMVCARRDTIRSRSGGACRIQAFRALVPAR